MKSNTNVIYRVNHDGRSKQLPKLKTTNNSVYSRTSVFLSLYGHNIWQWEAQSKNIKTEVLVCIAWADSHLWYALKGKNNVGNIWSFDRWGTYNFETLDQWIRAMTNTLNNQYLGIKQTIGDLNNAGDCKIDCDKMYATSTENRQNNTLNCLSLIYMKQINSDFIFRK
jgi:hypothetical protein